MTDTVAEKATELPVQVHPEPVQDPLYATVIATMEADLTAMRQRAVAAEERWTEEEPTRAQVLALREQFAKYEVALNNLGAKIDVVTAQQVEVVNTLRAIWQTHQKIYRT